MEIAPKTIVSRLNELNIGYNIGRAKKIARIMNRYEINNFEKILCDLVNDDCIDPELKSRGWEHVLISKWRRGYSTFDKALLDAINRLHQTNINTDESLSF
jgi:hypothetical protein